MADKATTAPATGVDRDRGWALSNWATRRLWSYVPDTTWDDEPPLAAATPVGRGRILRWLATAYLALQLQSSSSPHAAASI